jgi:hypothetical protein
MMTGIVIVFALLPSLLLGLLVLGVALLWHLPFQLLPSWYFILCGSLGALSMLGLLILGNHLGCLLTTYC